MLSFLAGTPGLGVEITSSAVRLAVLSGRGAKRSVQYVKTADLPAGLVAENYASLNISDTDELTRVLRECLDSAPANVKRTALSLPDGVFRVQILEFDQLPAKAVERERLIRWRLEKAAFDISDTVLRYEVLQQREQGFTVLACMAKQAVIEQYETLFFELGLEPWSIGLSSFHIINLYAPVILKKSPVFALAHLTDYSFTTVVTEADGARFYRYKEMKRGSTDDIKVRLMREIEDSLHFYTHMDRSQTAEVKDLFLSGEPALLGEFSEKIGAATSLNVEILSPAGVCTFASEQGTASPSLTSMAAALGAGSAL
jgi:Tfp pilus assembly PilM family ATPase